MSATLVRSVRLLALLGGIALTITGECQWLFLGVFFSFFLFGLKLADFPGLAQFFGKAQPFLALFSFSVAIIDFRYLSNSFLLTVAHFLLLVQAVRLLALQTNRECFGSVLLSSLMMLSASTLSVDWTYFLMLFVFLVAVIWTLMLLTLLEENKQASSFGGLAEGSLQWRDLMPVLRGATGTAFAIAFFCCAGVFVFFPRFNFQGFRGQFLQPIHKSGFTSQVDLSGSGKIYEDNSVVMRVEVEPSKRDLWTGYLRGRALESFDGKIWDNYPSRPEQVFHQRRGKIVLDGRGLTSKTLLRQRIYLESMDSPLLFAQASPVLVEIDRPFLEVGHEGSFQRRRGDAWRLRYEVESGPSAMNPGADLRSVPKAVPLKPVPRPNTSRRTLDEELLYVPAPAEPVIKKLASQAAGRALGAYAKAQAFQSYFQTQYRYSLGGLPPLETGKNPLEEFLLNVKQGHCELFAASMCLFLRSEGIPARMATGFLSNEWNSRGEYYIVRMKHAHAWVEAYIEPYGWVGFDPSPRVLGDGTSATLSERWSQTMDYINLRWNRYILSYDFERQVEIVKSVSSQSSRMSFRLGQWAGASKKFTTWLGSFAAIKAPSGKISYMGFGRALLLLAGLGIVVVALFKVLHRSHDRVWFYREFLRRLEKRIGKKTDSQTLREFLVQSEEKLGDRAADAAYLQDLYYRLRFGAVSGAPAVAAVREKLRNI